MSTKAKKTSLKSHVMAALSMALVAAVALGGATYAWFTFVSNPEIRDIEMYVKAADNIYLSPYDMDDVVNAGDMNKWFGTLVQEDNTGATYPNGIVNQQPGAFPQQLSDVSSVFTATNMNFFSRKNNDSGDFVEYLAATAPSYDTLANKPIGDYAKFEIWITATSSGAIFLDGDTAGALQSYVNGLEIGEVKEGIKHTVRIGFYMQSDSGSEERVVIWEPNSVGHVALVDGGPGAIGKAVTKAITAPGTVENAGTNQVAFDFGTGATNSINASRIALFDMTADDVLHFSVYIWVEGADADAVNKVAKSNIATKLRFGQWEAGANMTAVLVP